MAIPIVTASADTTARIWDAHTGVLRHTLTGHTAIVDSADLAQITEWS